jgi:hypothetical protein
LKNLQKPKLSPFTFFFATDLKTQCLSKKISQPPHKTCTWHFVDSHLKGCRRLGANLENARLAIPAYDVLGIMQAKRATKNPSHSGPGFFHENEIDY